MPKAKEPLRPGLVTLSLGKSTEQLEAIWRDYVLLDGQRASSKSEAVRDMIARAYVVVFDERKPRKRR